jgi:general secretion pathway protein A
MLEAYYGLNGQPFSKSLKPSELFISKNVSELLSRLEYMKVNRGIMLITGQPGSGKTSALRLFLSKLPDISYKSFYQPLSSVNVLDFYRQINAGLGGESYHFKSRLFASIQNSIRELVTNSKITPVFIFDEAHLLKNENLMELQIISNFNMDSHDPAIFIITGQSHLKDRLLRPVLKSFYRRIVLKFHLAPMEADEMGTFIEHNLKIKGCLKSPFSDEAVNAIFKNSNGFPGMAADLAIKTMTCGMQEKATLLTEEHVFTAAREI